MIRISVIIPAFNASNTIRRTINSLLVQKHTNWEAIVVDDGSRDNTVLVVQEFSIVDSRISLYSQSNKGVSAARNEGIAQARHDWLIFLDADDWISENYFETVSKAATGFPGVDVFHGAWVRVAADGTCLLKKQAPDYKDLFSELAVSCLFAIHSCVFRKSILSDSGVFDTSFLTCEDWDLWQRIARTGATFKFLENVMAFYTLRDGSLSKSIDQCFKDVIRVLDRGHTTDPRVLKSLNKHSEGMSSESLSLIKIYYTSWFIAHLIGERRDYSEALNALDKSMCLLVDADDIADILFETCILPSNQPLTYWPDLWQLIGEDIIEFLSAFEKFKRGEGLKKKCLLSLGRLIIKHGGKLNKIAIGPFYVVSIEITKQIPDYPISGEVERFYCLLECEGEALGSIEIPIWDQHVSARQAKAAIAKRFYWQILGQFYRKHRYRNIGAGEFVKDRISFDEMHNEKGWAVFLQDIWDRPSWALDQFYNPDDKSDIVTDTIELGTGFGIEISKDLANISCSEKPDLTVTVGGICLGTVNIPDSKYLSAQQIRVFVNTDMGLRLCEISVREALIGRPFDHPESLRQRLARSSALGVSGFNSLPRRKNQLIPKLQDNCILLKNSTGFYGSCIFKVVSVPCQILKEFKKMSGTLEKFEMKDLTQQTPNEINLTVKNQAESSIASIYNRHHFETLFTIEPDPWKYTHPYEQTKYEQTLSLLPENKINLALEIACAEGHFTEQLAPKVNQLLAVDISQVALKRAAKRCHAFNHIAYDHVDFFKEAIKGKFDLIVCSEVLYFVGDKEKLKQIAFQLSDALNMGGYLLTAHAHQIIDEPEKPGFDWQLTFGAKVIGEVIASTRYLRLQKEIRTPLYRIQLFKKEKSKVISRLRFSKPKIQFLEQPTPVPKRVESTVRLHGGKPSFPIDAYDVYSDKLPILMYHRISPAEDESMVRFRVSPAAFEEQLRYLKDCGFYSVKWNDWSQAMTLKKSLPGKPIALTFDDGYLDFYEYAWPLLKKYGFTATVFLVNDHIGSTNKWDVNFKEELRLMNWQQILQLSEDGVMFGSHSSTHTALTGLSPSQIFIEGIRSRTDLSRRLEYPVNMFAYPYGDTDELVTDIINSCGYQFGFSCIPGFSTLKDNSMLLPRIEVLGNEILQDFIKKIIT